MLNSLMGHVGWVITILIGLWMLQLWLSLAQSRRFHRHVMDLRREGDRTSVGMAGTKWTLRVYAILVVDEERIVTRARRFRGFTVFAHPQPMPFLQGLPLSRFFEDVPVEGVSSKLWKAFRHAAEFIRQADERDNQVEEDASIVVEQASSMPQGYTLSSAKRNKEE